MEGIRKIFYLFFALITFVTVYSDDAAQNDETVQMTYEKLQSQQTVLGTLWMQKSAEYRASVYQVYNSVKRRFLEEKKKKHPKKLAVVVDIDETILNNIYTQAEYIKEGKNFSSQEWDEWISAEKATALPGAVDFIDFIYRNGGEVFYLTNRKESERERTLNNLLKEKFIVDEKHLVMKTSESSKEARRRVIAEEYKVVAYLGDDLTDFVDGGATAEERIKKVDEIAGEFGKTYFIIPNPVHGSFEAAISFDYYSTDFKGRTEIRENNLKGWK